MNGSSFWCRAPPTFSSNKLFGKKIKSSVVTEGDICVIIGDFNQVKFIDQKLGGSSYLHRQEHFSRWRLGADSTKIS